MKPLPSVAKLTVNQIAEILTEESVNSSYLQALEADPRIGVQKLIAAYYRKKDRSAAIRQQWQTMCQHEAPYWEQDKLIIGVDEAGRGPLAGPVVAAAVVLAPDTFLPGLADSKTLTPEQRTILFEQIIEKALDFAVGIVGPKEIDILNILKATQLAMGKAISGIDISYQYIFIDGNQRCPYVQTAQKTIVKGDALSVSVAAASIVAKVTRDTLMVDLDAVYPGYGFAEHKGYPTSKHLTALNQLGPSPVHRRSFAPVAALCGKEQEEREQHYFRQGRRGTSG